MHTIIKVCMFFLFWEKEPSLQMNTFVLYSESNSVVKIFRWMWVKVFYKLTAVEGGGGA